MRVVDDSHWRGLDAPRIPPAQLREVNPLLRPLLAIAGRVTGGPPPHIFSTLARHPKLFVSWLVFAGRLMPRGRLPRAETELVILRVAWNCANRYEWNHHVRIGRRAGLSEADIERVPEDPAVADWSERRRALLMAADEIHTVGRISDPTWETLRREFDERQLIELPMLIGHYEMVAATISSLGIQPEARST
jgi:alkylhydroperoxidase family enzyme